MIFSGFEVAVLSLLSGLVLIAIVLGVLKLFWSMVMEFVRGDK